MGKCFRLSLASVFRICHFVPDHGLCMQAVNSFTAVRGVLSQAEATLGQTQQEADRAQARAERVEKALETALKTARVERAEELENARARAERAKEALEEATRRAASELDNAQVA